MNIKCNYYENDKVNVRFTFDLFPGTVYKPKHFKSHAYQYSYDDTLAWANKSLNLWNKTGIFLTAYVKSLWAGMPDKQRNTLFPKIRLMWTSLDGSTDDSIPGWINVAAGYLPLIKRLSGDDCLFFGTENDILKYFTEVTDPDEIPGTVLETDIVSDITMHIYCPHCGKKIF